MSGGFVPTRPYPSGRLRVFSTSSGLRYPASLIQKKHQKSQRKDLVGGFNPCEKYARQTGSFPQIGMKIKNI